MSKIFDSQVYEGASKMLQPIQRRIKKAQTQAGNASAEMNLQTGAKLVSVQRADINCVSTRCGSFAFLWRRLICITIGLLPRGKYLEDCARPR